MKNIISKKKFTGKTKRRKHTTLKKYSHTKEEWVPNLEFKYFDLDTVISEQTESYDFHKKVRSTLKNLISYFISEKQCVQTIMDERGECCDEDGNLIKKKSSIHSWKPVRIKQDVIDLFSSRLENVLPKKFLTYGLHIAEELSDLSPEVANYCQKLINDSIFEAKLGNFNSMIKGDKEPERNFMIHEPKMFSPQFNFGMKNVPFPRNVRPSSGNYMAHHQNHMGGPFLMSPPMPMRQQQMMNGYPVQMNHPNKTGAQEGSRMSMPHKSVYQMSNTN